MTALFCRVHVPSQTRMAAPLYIATMQHTLQVELHTRTTCNARIHPQLTQALPNVTLPGNATYPCIQVCPYANPRKLPLCLLLQIIIICGIGIGITQSKEPIHRPVFMYDAVRVHLSTCHYPRAAQSISSSMQAMQLQQEQHQLLHRSRSK